MREGSPEPRQRITYLLVSASIEEARDAYQLAVACDPHYAAAYFNLGNLNCRAREYEQALHNYGIAIRIKPDFADAFVAMANALDDFGTYRRSNRELPARTRRSALTTPRCTLTWAYSLKNKGDLTEAADRYKKAIDLGMTNPMASYMLAVWSGEACGIDARCDCYEFLRRLRVAVRHSSR